MSEGGFHIHGAHEHEIEHQAHGGDGLAQRVALMTAILSTLGAVFSYQGGVTQNEAIMYKNEAILKKTEASNQWNHYQSKSNKQTLAEFAAGSALPDKQEFYKSEVERYRKEKEDIKQNAEKLEKESAAADEKSAHMLHPHHKLAQAMTLIQIAIALASITALTRKTWLFIASGIAATGGIVMWALAWLT